MWSIGSDLTLKLNNKSVYYQKIIIVLTILSCYLILHSYIYWVLKVLMIGVLLGYFYYLFIYLDGFFSKIKLLSYQGKSWICEYQHNLHDTSIFSNVSILLKNGIFIVLKLKNQDAEKICVIFRDQITQQDLRKLMWIQKMQQDVQ